MSFFFLQARFVYPNWKQPNHGSAKKSTHGKKFYRKKVYFQFYEEEKSIF